MVGRTMDPALIYFLRYFCPQTFLIDLISALYTIAIYSPMAQCICEVVDAAISPLVSLATAHLTYLFKAEDSLNELKKVAAELAARTNDVRGRIESDQRTTGGTATNEVSEWLQAADDIAAEAEALQKRYGERRQCLGGCSADLWSSYVIGKTAAKMIPDARRELDRGVFQQVVAIPAGSHDKAEIDIPPPVGRKYNSYLEQAIEFINDDAVKIVGIWGMGGAGKTHLLKSINNRFARQTCFDVVLFVTASRACSVAKIQSEIVKTLGLAKREDVRDQARIISEFLREKSFLLLLDDLWKRLDLEAVGVPMPSGTTPDRHKGKVVLTTRYLKVCGQMGVSRTNIIKVECLDSDDAWLLFREMAGKEKISCNPAIENLARIVAKKLGGLPLALITIGKAMYDKEDPREWEHAIDLLQDARHDEVDPDNQEESSLFHNLKFSYDSLRDDALRDCLLCCSLWPEDYCIRKDDLILCLLGLGIIHDFDDMRSAYNIGYDLIGILRSACLLNDESFGFEVRVHDVIRDMALWIACDCGKKKKKWFVKAGLGLTEAPQGTKIDWSETDRISLMSNSIKAFHDFPAGSFPARLSILILQSNRLSEKSLAISPSLAVLTYLDLSSNRLKCFPENICKLTALRYLNLSENNIRELPVELKCLTSLEYLILRNNNVHIIPEGVIGELKALQMLDICGVRLDHYPPSLFKELEALKNLKALGINVKGVNQFNRLHELKRTPVWSLRISHFAQKTLNLQAAPLGSFPTHNNLFDLSILQSYSLEEIVFDIPSNSKRCFHNLDSLLFNGTQSLSITLDRLAARELFPKLCHLQFWLCGNLNDVSWIAHLPCLQILFMVQCGGLTQLIYNNEGEIVATGEGEGGRVSIPTFPSLKRMVLYQLLALQCVCDPAYTNFPSLEEFVVKDCPMLTKLPFRSRTIPKNLKFIRGDKTWRERIEWEDDSLRSSLQPFFQAR